ncbi:MAG: FxsA family protein, partial [Helicobacter sp.]|nr:FxsA family protein [Helicobacter sp.]
VVGSNIFRIHGAILIILPGGLTDILGILMQFSALGFLAVKPFMKKSASNSTPTSNKPQNSEIIDVEVIEK